MARLYMFLTLSLLMVGFSALAQDYTKGLKHELEDVEALYPKRSKATVSAASNVQEVQVNQQPVVQAAPPTVAAPAAAQPVYIIQQPTTNVDATPVKESRADQLRKQREEVEHQNEMKLIEKLEDDRLNAEKERMEKLQGITAAPATAKQQEAAPAQAAAPAQQQQLQASPTPIPVLVVNQPEAPVAAPQATVATAAPVEPVAQKQENKFQIGPMLGIANYPSVSNVSGVYSVGASAEWLFTDNMFSVSGDVMYSSFDIRNVVAVPCYYCAPIPGTPIITTMNQWNAGSTLKYRFIKGSSIKPYVGSYAGYTRRNYSARVSWGYNNDSYTGSNAFDGGLLAGVEIKASENVSFGAEFRYIWNISYRTDDPLAYGVSGYTYVIGSPIESLNYYFATANMRITL